MKEQTNEYYCVGRFCTDSYIISVIIAMCRKNIDGIIYVPRDDVFASPVIPNMEVQTIGMRLLESKININCIRKNRLEVKKILTPPLGEHKNMTRVLRNRTDILTKTRRVGIQIHEIFQSENKTAVKS